MADDGTTRGELQEIEDEKLFETSKDVQVVNSFDAMKLHKDLLRGIYAYGLN
jgi:ATP-dependent RNA helicase